MLDDSAANDIDLVIDIFTGSERWKELCFVGVCEETVVLSSQRWRDILTGDLGIFAVVFEKNLAGERDCACWSNQHENRQSLVDIHEVSRSQSVQLQASVLMLFVLIFDCRPQGTDTNHS